MSFYCVFFPRDSELHGALDAEHYPFMHLANTLHRVDTSLWRPHTSESQTYSYLYKLNQIGLFYMWLKLTTNELLPGRSFTSTTLASGGKMPR